MEEFSKYIDYLKSISDYFKNDEDTAGDTEVKIDTIDSESKDTNDKNLENNHIEEKTNINKISKTSTETSHCEKLFFSESISYEYDIPKDSKIINIPVVLAKCKIVTPISCKITLSYPIIEIKEIDKDIYLKKCSLAIDNNSCDAGFLFIDAVIKKHIEYYSKNENHNILKNTIVSIPFSLQTKIKFITMPEIHKDNECTETEISNIDNPDFIGQDIKEKNFTISKSLNRKIVCKIVNCEFIETDIIEGHPETFETYEISESSVAAIEVEVLQNQNVILKQ